MKVLFDVNVLVDIWGATDDFSCSYQSLDIALFKGFTPCIASSMTPSIVYLLTARKYFSKQGARDVFETLLKIVEVLDVTSSDCLSAQKSAVRDYEDALIAFSAKRHQVDFIITRNQRDFAGSAVPALTPQEFVNLYKPTCLEYEMIDLAECRGN